MKIEYNNNTLILIIYDEEDLHHVYNTFDEIERLLCKKLDIEQDEDNELEFFIDVDDYYEYQSLRRLIYNYTPIIWGLYERKLRYFR